jgi:CRISPR-associated protein Cas8a1/Csx13
MAKLNLFAPGMTMMHRVGLGGLASTLECWKESGETIPGKVEVYETQIEMDFDNPTKFFESLYRYAFQVRYRCIYLPGAWNGSLPSFEHLLFSTRGIASTILQHSKAKSFGETQIVPVSADLRQHLDWNDKVSSEDQENAVFAVREIKDFNHQRLAKSLISHSKLRTVVPDIAGTVAPGIMNMNATKETSISQRIDQALALHFLIVGAICFLSPSSGIMVVPEVDNLLDFLDQRGDLNPIDPESFYASSPAEAAYLVRGRMKQAKNLRVEAWKFQATSWVSKQKYRVGSVVVESGKAADAATEVMRLFPRRFAAKTLKKKEVSDTFFPLECPLRDFGLANLAAGRPWFHGFDRLWRKVRDDRNKINDGKFYPVETEGLYAMLKSKWTAEEDRIFSEAVMEATNNTFAKMRETARRNGQVLTNDTYNTKRDKWRQQFVTCRTAEDFERAIADFFSRSGPSTTITNNFSLINAMVSDPDGWEHARNLVLISLVASKPRMILKFQTDEDRAKVVALNGSLDKKAEIQEQDDHALRVGKSKDAYRLATLAQENGIEVKHLSD